MEQMRQEGGLKPNSFVLMERVGLSEADLLLKIEDHAHSEAYLSSAAMQKSANRVIQRGVIAPNAEYGGWLENYHRASPPQEGLTNVPSTMHLARPKLNRGRHLNTLRLGGTIVNF